MQAILTTQESNCATNPSPVIPCEYCGKPLIERNSDATYIVFGCKTCPDNACIERKTGRRVDKHGKM